MIAAWSLDLASVLIGAILGATGMLTLITLTKT